jgi:hypothetical protein
MRTKGTAGLPAFLLVWAALANAVPAAAAATSGGAGSGADAAHVARVSVLQSGTVSVTRGSGTTAVAATLNAPLLPGDAFATTDPGTLAEIQLDGFTDLRLGGGVKARIVNNDARARRIEMTSGLLELAVLRGGDLASEIVTPSFTLRTRYAGDYRVSLGSDGTASITPRAGQADVVMQQKIVTTIVAGTTIVVRGPAPDAPAQSHPAVARDSFDEFNAQRDRTLLAALESNTQVPASIAGYDDLGAYGRWTTLASYGHVWVPNDQSADFAPYRNGQWAYVGNDGWTWIGSEPWAWVPYHYGRWLYSAGYGWCWYPPPFGFDPVWAPALVGFFGYGDGPLGFSNFGWVPLAPFEAYLPWYPGRYYPPRHYHFPPPPPPRHHRPPVHVNPLVAAFRNARFGGASAIAASALRDGNFAHPIAVDSSRIGKVDIVKGAPVIPLAGLKPPVSATAMPPATMSALPAMAGAVPAIRATAPLVGAPTPARPISTPILHEAAPSHSVHSSSPHPPA